MIMFQVLRLVMLLRKQRQKGSSKPAGGLLVLVWTETNASAQRLNCTGMEVRTCLFCVATATFSCCCWVWWWWCLCLIDDSRFSAGIQPDLCIFERAFTPTNRAVTQPMLFKKLS